jgi:hypothetical protein
MSPGPRQPTLRREIVFPASRTDLYRHLVIGIVLTTCCLVLVGALMQFAVVVRSDSTVTAHRTTAEIDVPMCKDLGARSADYRGCALIVDETERQIIEQVFISECPTRIAPDAYLYSGSWRTTACYFSGPNAAGPIAVYAVSCDQQPMRWAAP